MVTASWGGSRAVIPSCGPPGVVFGPQTSPVLGFCPPSTSDVPCIQKRRATCQKSTKIACFEGRQGGVEHAISEDAPGRGAVSSLLLDVFDIGRRGKRTAAARNSTGRDPGRDGRSRIRRCLCQNSLLHLSSLSSRSASRRIEARRNWASDPSIRVRMTNGRSISERSSKLPALPAASRRAADNARILICGC
jgi:hypothetical protein